jgi:hypothetical protein
VVGFMKLERRVGREVECVDVRGLRVSRMRRFPGGTVSVSCR